MSKLNWAEYRDDMMLLWMVVHVCTLASSTSRPQHAKQHFARLRFTSRKHRLGQGSPIFTPTASAIYRGQRNLRDPSKLKVSALIGNWDESLVVYMSDPHPPLDASKKVANTGDFVKVFFVGRGETGEIKDTNVGGDPLELRLNSPGSYKSAFESATRGMQMGQTRRVKVNCTGRYSYRPGLVQNIPRELIPTGVHKGIWIEIENGNRGRVVEMSDRFCTVDFNHPLADAGTVDFDITLHEIFTEEGPVLDFGGAFDDETIEERAQMVQGVVEEIEGIRRVAQDPAFEESMLKETLPTPSLFADILNQQNGLESLSETLGINLRSEEMAITVVDTATGRVYRTINSNYDDQVPLKEPGNGRGTGKEDGPRFEARIANNSEDS
eukprot:jgi/Bigna1/135396/aug1.29_g10104